MLDKIEAEKRRHQGDNDGDGDDKQKPVGIGNVVQWVWEPGVKTSARPDMGLARIQIENRKQIMPEWVPRA